MRCYINAFVGQRFRKYSAVVIASLALSSECLDCLTQHLHCKQTLQLILSGILSFTPKTISLCISCLKLAKFMWPKRLCHFIASRVTYENKHSLLLTPHKYKPPTLFFIKAFVSSKVTVQPLLTA